MHQAKCNACGFSVIHPDSESATTTVMAHQTVCENLDEEKREYRKLFLELRVGEEKAEKLIKGL